MARSRACLLIRRRAEARTALSPAVEISDCFKFAQDALERALDADKTSRRPTSPATIYRYTRAYGLPIT